MNAKSTPPCPICTSQKILNVCKLKGSRTEEINPLYFCFKCNYYYQRPDYREDDKTLQGDLKYLISQASLNRKATRNKLELILKHKPNAKTVLDIGCGIGETIRASLELGLEAQGVEPNPYAVKYLKDNMPYGIKQGYFESNMFTRKFDIIILEMVLEHVTEPRKLIGNIFKILSKDGILYLSVPGRKGGVLRVLYSIINKSGYKSLFSDNDAHINHFSKTSIKALLKGNNAVITLEPQPGVFIIRKEPTEG